MSYDEVDAIGEAVVAVARWTASHLPDISHTLRIIETLAKWFRAVFDAVLPRTQTIGMGTIESTVQLHEPGVVYGSASLVGAATMRATGTVIPAPPRC